MRTLFNPVILIQNIRVFLPLCSVGLILEVLQPHLVVFFHPPPLRSGGYS